MRVTDWPALPYTEWRATRDTLHMYTQVLGKLRLALSPFEPEWGHVALYVTARGLTTSPLPVGLRTVDAEVDLLEHMLVLRGSDGHTERSPLGGSVAEFYADVMAGLRRMGVEVAISTLPSEVDDPIPFPDDTEHATYDGDQAARFFQALSMVTVVLKEHRARFRGRSTPVHFFWGSFDLALTRFSGRPADPPAGGGVIARVGGDAEQICAGWWPGSERLPFAAFYAYGYPAPDGVADIPLQPRSAGWNAAAGEHLLEYEAARAEPDPREAIVQFLGSTYAGTAALLGWDPSLTQVEPPTPAAELTVHLPGGPPWPANATTSTRSETTSSPPAPAASTARPPGSATGCTSASARSVVTSAVVTPRRASTPPRTTTRSVTR